ncbi:MAG: hypothetical protein RLZZ361_902, partial [Cyanobacteriota bacterium]
MALIIAFTFKSKVIVQFDIMSQVVKCNYSFLNIFKKTMVFIKKYPRAFWEIFYKTIFLSFLSLFVSILPFTLFLFVIFISLKGVNVFSFYIILITTLAFAQHLTLRPLRITVVSVYKKYVYGDLKRMNLITNYFKIYLLTLKEFFYVDLLIIFAIAFGLKFINPIMFFIFVIIACIYIASTRFFKFFKLQLLPFTFMLEPINDEKKLLEYVYNIPLTSILLMNFYEIIISLVGIFSSNFFKSLVSNNEIFLESIVLKLITGIIIFTITVLVSVFGDIFST